MDINDFDPRRPPQDYEPAQEAAKRLAESREEVRKAIFGEPQGLYATDGAQSASNEVDPDRGVPWRGYLRRAAAEHERTAERLHSEARIYAALSRKFLTLAAI